MSLRSLICGVAAMIQTGCMTVPGVQPDPGNPRALAFEANGYEGALTIWPSNNDQDLLCRIPYKGRPSLQPAPDCRDGFELPERLLRPTAVNSKEGMRFGVAFGSGGWNSWQIRARCWPDPCPAGDWSKLSVDVEVNREGSQFNQAHFSIQDGVMALNTLDIEYISAPMNLDNVAAYSVGLRAERDSRVTLVYPGVYQVVYTDPNTTQLVDPADGRTKPFFHHRSAFLAVLPDRTLYWARPPATNNEACNQARVRNCLPIQPSGVAARVVSKPRGE